MFQYLATLRIVEKKRFPLEWEKLEIISLRQNFIFKCNSARESFFFHSSFPLSSIAIASLSHCSQRERATKTDSLALRISSLLFSLFYFVPILYVCVQLLCLCVVLLVVRPFKIYISHKRNHFSRSALVARLWGRRKIGLQICEIK